MIKIMPSRFTRMERPSILLIEGVTFGCEQGLRAGHRYPFDGARGTGIWPFDRTQYKNVIGTFSQAWVKVDAKMGTVRTRGTPAPSTTVTYGLASQCE